MADQTTNDLSDNIQWMAYQLRLTSFPIPLSQFDPTNWWHDTVGEIPESQQIQPKLNRRTEIGPFENGKLILEVQSDRIDWRYSSIIDDPLRIPFSEEELVPLQNLLSGFQQIANHWLGMAPPLIRLAFGGRLGIPVVSRSEGYQHLADYLHPVRLNPDNMSDFLYQINRPVISNIVPDLQLNRLSKWSVVSATRGTIVIGEQGPTSTTLTHEFFYSHLELDINTRAENTDNFQSELLFPLFMELVHLGQGIAFNGDEL